MKKHQRLKNVFAAILAIGMMMTAPSVVHAGGNGPISTGSGVNDQASVTVYGRLKMPEGTTTPVGTLTFTFTKVSVDGSTDAAQLATMPAISPSVSFSATDAGDVTSGIKIVSKGVTVNGAGSYLAFPHAGEYIYSVAQTHDFDLITDADLQETMDYSSASYQVQFIVANSSDGTGTYVKSISVNLPGTSGGQVGAKVGSGDGNEGDHFSFDNKFNRIHLNDPADPDDLNDTNLRISKNVAGDSADQTKYFNFKVKMTAPAIVTGTAPTVYHAVIMDSTGTAIDPANNKISDYGEVGSDHIFSISIGQDFEFKLKHGETLVILDAPVGAKYSASETAEASYTATYTQTVNGTPSSGTGSSVADTLIGEAANNLAFTNTMATITPTGIMINNLPYVVLGILAAGLLVILMRRNKRTA